MNPRGSIADGLYNEDSAKEDLSPDFEFDVATGRFAGGWTAEFRIPFSSLRYTDPKAAEFRELAAKYKAESRYDITDTLFVYRDGRFVRFTGK